MLAEGAKGIAAQAILKYTDEPLQFITAAPVSGVYEMNADGKLMLKRQGHRRRDALAENEAFVMRIMGVGEYAYKGGDLAIMFMNQAIRSEQGQLTPAGQRWVAALQGCFEYRPLNQEERYLVELAHNPVNIKSGPEQ